MVTASDIERTIANELREVQQYLDRNEKEREILREQRRGITRRINTLDSYIEKAKKRRWTLVNEPPTGIKNSPKDTEYVLTDDLAAVIREWLQDRPDRSLAELAREARLNTRRVRMIVGTRKQRYNFTTFRIFEQLALAMDRYDLFHDDAIKIWSLHSKRIYDKVLREQRNGRREDN